MILATHADGRGNGGTAGIVRGTIGGKDSEGETLTAGIDKEGEARVDKSEGDYRERPGVGNDGRG